MHLDLVSGDFATEALAHGPHQGGVALKRLQRYLDEFVFRFNRRKSQHVGKIFYRLAEQLVWHENHDI